MFAFTSEEPGNSFSGGTCCVLAKCATAGPENYCLVTSWRLA